MKSETIADARALRDAVRRLIVAHGVLDEGRRPCGTPLSAPHAWALLELRERGALTVTALAGRLQIDRTNVSRLCARMEAAGDVERVAHPLDGRARLVRLSRKGRRLAAAVDAASAEHFAAVAGRLGAEVAGVVRTLEALERAMAASRPEAEEVP